MIVLMIWPALAPWPWRAEQAGSTVSAWPRAGAGWSALAAGEVLGYLGWG